MKILAITLVCAVTVISLCASGRGQTDSGSGDSGSGGSGDSGSGDSGSGDSGDSGSGDSGDSSSSDSGDDGVTQSSDDDTASNAAIIAGAIIGVIFLLALIMACIPICFCIVRAFLSKGRHGRPTVPRHAKVIASSTHSDHQTAQYPGTENIALQPVEY